MMFKPILVITLVILVLHEGNTGKYLNLSGHFCIGLLFLFFNSTFLSVFYSFLTFQSTLIN